MTTIKVDSKGRAAVTDLTPPSWPKSDPADPFMLRVRIEVIHRKLAKDEDERYLRYLTAVYDADSVEGTLYADDLEAAACIRDAARMKGDAVGSMRKHDIVLALRRVLNRYGQSRKQRRDQIANADESAPDEQ